jgi:hypothetical protein
MFGDGFTKILGSLGMRDAHSEKTRATAESFWLQSAAIHVPRFLMLMPLNFYRATQRQQMRPVALRAAPGCSQRDH